MLDECTDSFERHMARSGRMLDLPPINSGQWCDAHGIRLERLYGTPMHQRGATLPDLGLRPIPREKMSCLKPGELGSPEFTIEGWLERIERR